jgi:hypothetical protein
MNDLGHWQTSLPFPEEPFGFIYCITNTTNNRKYIGKKQMTCVRKLKPLKGKKNKRHQIVETDWKSYTGSCNELNKDMESVGKEKFHFEILRFCSSKSEMAYYEAKMQFDRDVLLKEDYYNGIINLRVGKIKNAN